MTHFTTTPNCNYHSFGWLKNAMSIWPALEAQGWRRTQRFGWVCPDCLAKHPDLQHKALATGGQREPAELHGQLTLEATHDR